MNTLIAQMSMELALVLWGLVVLAKIVFAFWIARKVWNWIFPSWPAGTTGPIGARLDARDEERALERAIAEVEAMNLTHEQLQEALIGPRFLDPVTGKLPVEEPLPNNVIPLHR
jgi:hypothetical protein